MYCENEKETNNKSKSKVEKRILKHIKFNSVNQEKNGELKSSDPLIPNESACKLLIENSISKDNQCRSKSIKNSCRIEDSPFYIHKVGYFNVLTYIFGFISNRFLFNLSYV